MRDPAGRTIRYLRLSLTEACDMRCLYCRPSSDDSVDRKPPLSADEVASLVRRLVECHGLRKVRITGGEPTARTDLVEVVRRLSAIAGLDDLAMTTSGGGLAERAAALKDAGLRRVNISLDSLDPQTFRRITGVDGLDRVLESVDAALAAGLCPVKLNAVVIRDENEGELPALVEFAARKDVEIRFIELMPMGRLADAWNGRFVPESQMRERLGGAVESWTPLPSAGASSLRFQVRLAGGAEAVVGFISPMSRPFCEGCDRIRIGAAGAFYPCLMDEPAGSLLPALRPLFDPALLDRLLLDGLGAKAAEHPPAGADAMTRIGG